MYDPLYLAHISALTHAHRYVHVAWDRASDVCLYPDQCRRLLGTKWRGEKVAGHLTPLVPGCSARVATKSLNVNEEIVLGFG